MGLLNVQNLDKFFGQRQILNQISFTVERGDRVALIGPNGAGKTTLVRICMGLLAADGGHASLARGVKAGFLTQDLSTLEADPDALTISEIAGIERKMRALEAEMAEGKGDLEGQMARYARLTARFETLGGYTVESRLKATLLGLGLREEALATPLSQLSSGERMRAALARILLTEPDLLVLDEPTNHLDTQAAIWLEGYLRKFPGGVLMISHDRYFLDRVSTRILELSQGTLLGFGGNYSAFLQQRQVRMAFVQSEQKRLDTEIRNQSDLARRLRAHARITQAQSREKRVERLKKEREGLKQAGREGHLGKISAPGLALKRDVHQSAHIAQAKRAAKGFEGRVLFENASFLIRGGEHVGIVGPNGCGKTTLLRILLGKDAPSLGVCRIGEWVKVGLLDQNAEFADQSLTMLEEMAKVKDADEPGLRRILGRVGFYGEDVHKAISVLSGGERVRLKLALLLAAEPQCLVLDEPTNHLDLPAREAVERAVAEFPGCVIAVSHDRYFLNRCMGRILAFEDGGIQSYPGNWDAYQQALLKRDDIASGQKGETKKARQLRARDLEGQILSLETEKNRLAQSGAQSGATSARREYQRVERELVRLYEAWAAAEQE